MRALRLLGYALLTIFAVIVAAAFFVYHNQRRIAELALAQIHQRTGCDIQISGTQLDIGSRLSVVLKNPRVLFRGQEVARLENIRAILNFRSLIHNYGLPLYRLGLDRPKVTLPARQADVTVAGIPRLDAKAVDALKQGLDALSDTAMQVDVYDGTVTDSAGLGIVEHIDLHAYRRHHRQPGKWPWLLDFAAAFTHPPVDGLHTSGSLVLGSENSVANSIARGQAWFWSFKLSDFPIGSFTLTDIADGHLSFVIDQAGVLTGTSETNLHRIIIAGNAMLKPQELGDAQLLSKFHAAPDELTLSSIELQRSGADIAQAQATMGHPYEDGRTLTFSASTEPLDIPSLGSFVRSIRDLPPRLIELVGNVDSGKVSIASAAVNTTQPLREWNLQTLRNNFTSNLVIRDGGCHFAADAKLPAIRGLSSQVAYNPGRLQFTQTGLDFGNTHIAQLSLDANLRDLPKLIRYKLQSRADLDIAELYPLAKDRMQTFLPAATSHVAKLEGRSTSSVDLSGVLDLSSPGLPHDYLANIALDHVTATTINPNAQISIQQGQVKLSPDTLDIDHLRLLPAGATGGDITFNGIVELRPNATAMRDFSAELHGIKIEQWLPFVVEPDSLAVHGAVGGVIHANTNPKSSIPELTGRLTLSDGDLMFGFLRSPIVTRSAILTFNGPGLQLSIASGKFEDQPVDFNLDVRDLGHPEVQIEAMASKIDFLALNFIRLPWSPHRPPHFFAVPVSGHIGAHAATFDRLPLKEVSTDFSRDFTDWHIKNFKCEAFTGNVGLSIDGKTGPNNWIHVIGKIDGSEVGGIFRMLDATKKPALTGKLTADGDFWANTDTDFFDTLAGTVRFTIADGVADRFTALSRVLGLIDLKSWLTAQIPDPTVHGLPFKTISGLMKGHKGDFYTDDLRLAGPVMDLAAEGHILFSSGHVDMEVGAFPFNTANWLISHIPIIGDNLAAGSNGLVAAYFHVYGPFKDPSVVPMPITSVTEFIKKVLGLPINIIVPNTIK
ncbi:MAG TPA: AsmA-like C-terminal domain-containing protein [Candidatus Binataceae bacterium]|nr:AsmA-like C-terminal domain-containing protein [Candidatus Binataceae bacterium]